MAEPVEPLDGALVVVVGFAVAVRRLVVAVVCELFGRTVAGLLADGVADAAGVAGAEVVGCVDGAAASVVSSGAAVPAVVAAGLVAARRISRSPVPAPATIVAEPAPISPRAPMAVRT
ncbi:hypothetical protein Aca07nite_00960 [Actinoplanes capillaceus]|uniref:Uncharacterized protein n=1 Tax=Actinoplanes campanulatus TaxID=113559 RepID=A0ABQ3WAD2_9ACTN|nr:hypothetical protein Aca07nite_00960 [Actinoplanes capillaceus]